MKLSSLIHKRLAAAVCAAAIAASFAGWTLRNERERAARGQRMVVVLKAKKFVAAGKPVTVDAVEETVVPEAYAPPSAVGKSAGLIDARGRPRFTARTGFAKGEFITSSLLSEPSAFGGLSWALEPGEVAFSVRLDPENAVAGFVQPGDFVNVFVISPGGSRAALERVRVAAVGDRAWDAVGGAASEVAKPLASEPVLITLKGTPEDAQALNQAMLKGSLRLALVSPLAGAQGE